MEEEMHIHLRNENKVKRLPRAIQEYMRRRFDLLPEYLELLRCFEYEGQVNSEQVKRISIFCPLNAQEKSLFIRTRQDLEQHPEILLYEGHVDNQGNAYVADRRATIVKAKNI